MPFYHHCYTKGFTAGYDGHQFVQAIPHNPGYSTVWASADLKNYLAVDLEKISSKIASPIFNREYESIYLIPDAITGRAVLGHYRNHMDGNFVDGRINFFIHNIIIDNADFEDIIYSRDVATGKNSKIKHLLSIRFKDTYVRQQTAPNELSYQEPVTASLKDVFALETDELLAHVQRCSVSYEAARSIVYYILKTPQPVVFTLCDRQEKADSSRSSQGLHARALAIMMALYEILPRRALETIGFVTGLNTLDPPKGCRLLFCSREVAEKIKSVGLKEVKADNIVFIDDERKVFPSVLPPSRSKDEAEYLDMLARYIAEGTRPEAKGELDKLEERYRMIPHSVLYLASLYAVTSNMSKPSRDNNESFKLIYDILWNRFKQNKNNVLDRIDDYLRNCFDQMEISKGTCDEVLGDYTQTDSANLISFCNRYILNKEDKEHIQFFVIITTFRNHSIEELCEDLKQYINTPLFVKNIFSFMLQRWDTEDYEERLGILISRNSVIKKAYNLYQNNDDIRNPIEELMFKVYVHHNIGQLCDDLKVYIDFPVFVKTILSDMLQRWNVEEYDEKKNGFLIRNSAIKKIYEKYKYDNDIRNLTEQLMAKVSERNNAKQLCKDILWWPSLLSVFLDSRRKKRHQDQKKDNLVDCTDFPLLLDQFKYDTQKRAELIQFLQEELSQFDTSELCSRLNTYCNQKDCVRTILDCMSERCECGDLYEAQKVNIDIVIQEAYMPYSDDIFIRDSLSRLAKAKLSVQTDFFSSYLNNDGSIVFAMLFGSFANNYYQALQIIQDYPYRVENYTEQFLEVINRRDSSSSMTADLNKITNDFAYQLASEESALHSIAKIKRVPFEFSNVVNDKIEATVAKYVKNGIINNIPTDHNGYGRDALEMLNVFRRNSQQYDELVAEAVTASACTCSSIGIPNNLVSNIFSFRNIDIGQMINDKLGLAFHQLGRIDQFYALNCRIRYTNFLNKLNQTVPQWWKDKFVETYHYCEYPTYETSLSWIEKIKLAFEKNEDRPAALNNLCKHTIVFANSLAENICFHHFKSDDMYNECFEIVAFLNESKENALYSVFSSIMNDMLIQCKSDLENGQMDFASYAQLIVNLVDLQFERISDNARWLLEESNPERLLLLDQSDNDKIEYYEQISGTVCQYWGEKQDSPCIDRKILLVDKCLNKALSSPKKSAVKSKIKKKYGIPKEKDVFLCRLRINQSIQEQQATHSKKKKRKVPLIISLGVIMALVALGIVIYPKVINPAIKYYHAIDLKNNGNFDNAASAFDELGNYKDAKSQADECKYQMAINLKDAGEYEKAASAFDELGNYKDAKSQADECKYQMAINLKDAGEYEKAASAFDELGNYKDAKSQADECRKQM